MVVQSVPANSHAAAKGVLVRSRLVAVDGVAMIRNHLDSVLRLKGRDDDARFTFTPPAADQPPARSPITPTAASNSPANQRPRPHNAADEEPAGAASDASAAARLGAGADSGQQQKCPACSDTFLDGEALATHLVGFHYQRLGAALVPPSPVSAAAAGAKTRELSTLKTKTSCVFSCARCGWRVFVLGEYKLDLTWLSKEGQMAHTLRVLVCMVFI